MIERELADLERAASERPGDREARWALARALERAGERARWWRALCDLARERDAEAHAALAAFDPWPAPAGWQGTRRARRTGPLEPPAVGPVRAIAVRPRETARLVAVTDESVVFEQAGLRLEPIPDAWGTDLADPSEVRWQMPQRSRTARIVRLGPDLLEVDERRLALLRVADGAPIAEAVTQGFEHRALDGDLLVGRCRRMLSRRGPLAAVSLAERDLGEVLWREESADWSVQATVGGRTLLVDPRQRLRALATASGETLWEVDPFARRRPGDRLIRIGADERGIVLLEERGEGPGGPRHALAEHDPATGAPRWSFVLDRHPRVAIGADVVVAATGSARATGIRAIERAGGRERWHLVASGDVIADPRFDGALERFELVLGEDMAYLAAPWRGGEERIDVAGIALADGAVAFRETVSLAGAVSETFLANASLALVPTDGALLLVAMSAGALGTVAVRLTTPAPAG